MGMGELTEIHSHVIIIIILLSIMDGRLYTNVVIAVVIVVGLEAKQRNSASSHFQCIESEIGKYTLQTPLTYQMQRIESNFQSSFNPQSVKT